MTDYVVYDVFTEKAFGGNPLAVIPDATGLDEAHLLTITREFGFSETTFVYPPEDPGHTARVRIFTPGQEIPFAGHPTVGTALALADLGRGGAEMVLELGVGPLPVSVTDGRARFTTRVPLSVTEGLDPDTIGRMIGVPENAIRVDRHAPIGAGVGIDFYLAELTDLDTLAAAAPRVDVFREVGGPDATRVGLLAYLRDGSEIRARMFAPLHGIMEDPATGSAAAALAGWLGKLDGTSQAFRIQQGIEMGRPSLIEAEVVVEGGAPVAVSIGGAAVKVMEGRLTL